MIQIKSLSRNIVEYLPAAIPQALQKLTHHTFAIATELELPEATAIHPNPLHCENDRDQSDTGKQFGPPRRMREISEPFHDRD